MKNKLILIGGGGHCKACIEVIEQEDKYSIYGVLDKEDLMGQKVLNYTIIGTDAMIPALVAQGYAFLITVGQIKSAALRKRIYNDLVSLQAEIVSVISPRANVSKYASIGKGSIIMHGAHVNAGAFIGENNIVNTGAIIEHDVKIGGHCHISTNAVLNGDCTIGNECFIGSNATILNAINIDNKVLVGAATMVNKDIAQPGTYVGNPFRMIN